MKQYDFTDLVLLVGTNPLPNYVVGKFFLGENKGLERIWLVCSSGTAKIAQNLENSLKEVIKENNLKIEIRMPELKNESSVKYIEEDFQSSKFNLLRKSKKVHLNYTGGTKAMAVHLHRLVGTINNDPSYFSYLDARSFKLIDDKDNVIVDDMRIPIILTMEQIIKLHGFKRNNKDTLYSFPDTIKKISDFINSNPPKISAFIEQRSKANESFPTKKEPSKSVNLNDTYFNVYKEIVETIPQKYWKGSSDSFQGFNDQYVYKLVNGGEWLEIYTKLILEENNKNFSSIYSNWEIKAISWETKSDQKFELDVIIIKGYQLLGISCTIGEDRSECKKKGFEMSHRIKQIGGEEARTIVICGMKKQSAKELKDELLFDTGGKDNIDIIGIEDLRKDEIINRAIKIMGIN